MADSSIVPITLVSGLYRSGKMALLQSLRRKSHASIESMSIVEMDEGDDMLEGLRIQIERILDSGSCKYLVIGAAGVCEPMRVADMLSMTGLPVALDTCVTVVDAASLMSIIEDTCLIHGVDEDEKEIRSDVCLRQIEFANVIVLSNNASDEGSEQATALVRSLNPLAKVVSSVEVDDVISTGTFDVEKTEHGAGWMTKADRSLPGYGVCSYVYKADRPFHPVRVYEFMKRYFIVRQEDGESLYDASMLLREAERNMQKALDIISLEKTSTVLDESMASLKQALEDISQESSCIAQNDYDYQLFKGEFGTIVRSKGHIWLADRPGLYGEWSQSGATLQCCCGGSWGASGRRGQEITFVGLHIDTQALKAALDGCLFSTEEEESDYQETPDPFAAWPQEDSVQKDTIIPLGSIIPITDGASEAQQILDSVEPGTTIIVYWHAEWHAQGDEVLAELRSMVEHAPTIVIHVTIGDHPPNWSFAMEKVMNKPEANRPGAKPVLKHGHTCWPCFTIHSAPSLQPIETLSGGRAVNTLRKIISQLSSVHPGEDKEEHTPPLTSSAEATHVWTPGAVFPHLQNGAVELRELLKRFAQDKKSLYILWEEGGIPLKILHALQDIDTIRPDTNNLFIATVGSSPGNEALAKALGVKKGPSLLVFSNMKVDKKYDGPDKVRDALAQEFRTLPTEPVSRKLPTSSQTVQRSIYDPPQGKQNRSGVTKLTPEGNLVHYFPKMPCLKCGNPWWTSDDWDALCLRCGWNCQSDGYDDDSNPLPKYRDTWASYCASIKSGITPAWKKNTQSHTRRRL